MAEKNTWWKISPDLALQCFHSEEWKKRKGVNVAQHVRSLCVDCSFLWVRILKRWVRNKTIISLFSSKYFLKQLKYVSAMHCYYSVPLPSFLKGMHVWSNANHLPCMFCSAITEEKKDVKKVWVHKVWKWRRKKDNYCPQYFLLYDNQFRHSL